MDLGYSLNPAIDIGQVLETKPLETIKTRVLCLCLNSEHVFQIEGAFVQGLGWVALEEVKWGDASHKRIKPGNLLTCGPGNYKIPSINDIPFNFNVSLLKVYICNNKKLCDFTWKARKLP